MLSTLPLSDTQLFPSLLVPACNSCMLGNFSISSIPLIMEFFLYSPGYPRLATTTHREAFLFNSTDSLLSLPLL